MKKILAALLFVPLLAYARVVHPVANLTVNVPASWAGYGATCALTTPTTVISRVADSTGKCYFGYVNYAGNYSVVAYQLNQYSQADGVVSSEAFYLAPVGFNPTPTVVVELE